MGLLSSYMLQYELHDPARACYSRGLFKYTLDSKGLNVTQDGFSGTRIWVRVDGRARRVGPS